MGILFGIILPLLDMLSDGYLFYNTMIFKGDSIAMAGCRVCHHAESAIDYSTQNTCDICVTDEVYLGGIVCGSVPTVLDKMTEMLEHGLCLENGTLNLQDWANDAKAKPAVGPIQRM